MTTDESTPVKKEEESEPVNPKKRKFDEFKDNLLLQPERQDEEVPKAKYIKRNTEETITPTKVLIDLSKYTYA